LRGTRTWNCEENIWAERYLYIGENYREKLGVKAIFAEGPKEKRVA